MLKSAKNLKATYPLWRAYEVISRSIYGQIFRPNFSVKHIRGDYNRFRCQNKDVCSNQLQTIINQADKSESKPFCLRFSQNNGIRLADKSLKVFHLKVPRSKFKFEASRNSPRIPLKGPLKLTLSFLSLIFLRLFKLFSVKYITSILSWFWLVNCIDEGAFTWISINGD